MKSHEVNVLAGVSTMRFRGVHLGFWLGKMIGLLAHAGGGFPLKAFL